MAPPSDNTQQQPTPTHRTPRGKFKNPWPASKPHGLRDVLRWALERRTKGRAERRAAQAPTSAFPVTKPTFPAPRASTDEILLTWIGHSSFLLQIGSINILLDPVWSNRASPVSFAGPARIIPPSLSFDALPPIDLVIVSHDHYDHLDRSTVRMLRTSHPGAKWLAPLGVGAWLRNRGVSVIAELDWWQNLTTLGIEITCTPAQHFSGRRLNNRDSTLWCGWTIRAGSRAVYFAGDTGRHPEFSEITRRLGPFDAALLPIGAYNPRWFMQPVHMSPEEAVSAYMDIAAANDGRACSFVATHWGTFRLTDEPMEEPPALTRVTWSIAGLDPSLLCIPAHGETVAVFPLSR
ncbi:MAG: MBL fold metallo-hydrolase [Gemmatimonadaceae bacterium]